jgi:hypothetical protein
MAMEWCKMYADPERRITVYGDVTEFYEKNPWFIYFQDRVEEFEG